MTTINATYRTADVLAAMRAATETYWQEQGIDDTWSQGHSEDWASAAATWLTVDGDVEMTTDEARAAVTEWLESLDDATSTRFAQIAAEVVA